MSVVIQLIPNSQTGGQRYSDTIPFSIPCCSIQIDSASMHCQCTAYTKSYDTGLTTAEDQKLQCFRWTANNIFIITMKIPQTHYVVKSCKYFISLGLSLCVCYDFYCQYGPESTTASTAQQTLLPQWLSTVAALKKLHASMQCESAMTINGSYSYV